MKKPLEISLETARKAYPTAPVELKVVFEETFGKNQLIGDITDRIKSFDDVLKYHDTDIYDFAKQIGKMSTRQSSFYALELIQKCLNEGKEIPLGESRYYPAFNVRGSNLDFYASNYYNYIPYGTIFYFVSKKISDHAGKTFINFYEDLLK